MNPENTQELWQVEANGTVYDTDFAEMTSWIDNGTLARNHKVRKGNLRWIEAGKVPSLNSVFNAKDNGQPVAPVITATMLGPTQLAGSSATNPVNPPPIDPAPTPNACSMHPEFDAVYLCDTCSNQFCKTCPNSYGGTVKICPFCGAMCKPLAKSTAASSYSQQYTHPAPVDGKFGFSDFGEALAYPFKFKTSLIMGAVMYAVFTVCQGAMGFGGIFMMFGALMSFLMANTLTFGVLANTVENFSQGKIGLNFMPSFDDFSIWDDVVHPFFLSIGVYIVSFGPLLAVFLAAIFMVVGSVTNEMNSMQSEAARTVRPDLPYASKAANQSEKVKELLNKQNDIQNQRIAALETGDEPPDTGFKPGMTAADEDAEFERLNNMIQESRKEQLESTIGKAPDTVTKERSAMIKSILGYGVMFLLLGGVSLLWGLFYFPAANIVAGYTRSFSATINPSVGFDTIKRLGADYAKDPDPSCLKRCVERMRGHEDSLVRAERADADLLAESSWICEGRRGSLRTCHDGLKRLVILFKPGRIHIRHIIGEDLHLTFLRQRAGKNGIDGSVHMYAST